MKTGRLILVLLVLAVSFHCRLPEETSRTASPRDEGPVFGGVLRVGVRSDPLTWNRLLATDAVTHEITEQVHAALVRVNRVTEEVEPALAESWSFSDEGRELTFRLRPEVF
ncbi:MAG TPA: hypothetical protein VGC53_01730, partial [Vicinamibacteria bacterium]